MSVTAVQATTPSTTVRAGAKLAADFDTFLQLLTTQLKTQDPLSPMDAEQFTSQLVQFSGVEQAIQTNSKLEKLIALVQTSQATSALQYIGATVELDNSRIQLPTGGQGIIAYELAAPAATVQLQVLNERGELVRQLAGPTGVGPQTLAWDGLDGDRRGQPAGAYRVTVTARDALGSDVPVSLATTGRVEALMQTAEGLLLTVDGRAYPMASVRAVRPAA